MTVVEALAWLKHLQAEDSWSMDFGASVRNVLPQLIGAIEAAYALGDLSHLFEYEGDESQCEWRKLSAALTALAEAIAREQEK